MGLCLLLLYFIRECIWVGGEGEGKGFSVCFSCVVLQLTVTVHVILTQVEASAGQEGLKFSLSQNLLRLANHKLGLDLSLSALESASRPNSTETQGLEGLEGEAMNISEGRVTVSRQTDTLSPPRQGMSNAQAKESICRGDHHTMVRGNKNAMIQGRGISETDFNNREWLSSEEEGRSREKHSRIQDVSTFNDLEEFGEDEVVSKQKKCKTQDERNSKGLKLTMCSDERERVVGEEQEYGVHHHTILPQLRSKAREPKQDLMEDRTQYETNMLTSKNDYRRQDETNFNYLEQFHCQEERETLKDQQDGEADSNLEELSNDVAGREQKLMEDETDFTALEQLTGEERDTQEEEQQPTMLDYSKHISGEAEDGERMQIEINSTDLTQCSTDEEEASKEQEHGQPDETDITQLSKNDCGKMRVNLECRMHFDLGVDQEEAPSTELECMGNNEMDFNDLVEVSDDGEREEEGSLQYRLLGETDFNILEEVGGEDFEQGREQELEKHDETDFNDLEELSGDGGELLRFISHQSTQPCVYSYAQQSTQRNIQHYVCPSEILNSTD